MYGLPYSFYHPEGEWVRDGQTIQSESESNGQTTQVASFNAHIIKKKKQLHTGTS